MRFRRVGRRWMRFKNVALLRTPPPSSFIGGQLSSFGVLIVNLN